MQCVCDLQGACCQLLSAACSSWIQPRTRRLLSQDDRNFHGWQYRRFIAARAGLTPEAEVAYARECIHTNFSNYSAWHARSLLLPQLPENQAPRSLQDLLKEPPGELRCSAQAWNQVALCSLWTSSRCGAEHAA